MFTAVNWKKQQWTIFLSMQDLRGISKMDAVALFLQFIPLEGEVHDFFQPVTRQILNLLRGRDCLPSDYHTNHTSAKPIYLLLANSETSEEPFEDQEVSWKQPSQLLVVKDKFSFIRENIQQALLTRSLDLLYLNPSVLPFINPTLQHQLGLRDINLQHLKEVAETAIDIYTNSRKDDVIVSNSDSEEESVSDAKQSKPLNKKDKQNARNVFIKWVANWLACVHLVIEDANDISTVTAIDSLKKLKIIPLLDGSLSSTDDMALFFPPESQKGEHYIGCPYYNYRIHL